MTEPIKHPRGLTYRGDVGTVSVYDFWLRGRVVLEVAVDNDDPELTIKVGKPGATETDDFVPTKGRAQISEVTADDEVTVVSRMISSNTIRYYVEPRLAVLIARVFVPGDLYAA